MPAPIAPCTSASDALTIWMLSTAMKAPSVAPSTAIQTLAGTCAAGAVAAGAGLLRPDVAAVAWSAVMASLLSFSRGRWIGPLVLIIEEVVKGLSGED